MLKMGNAKMNKDFFFNKNLLSESEFKKNYNLLVKKEIRLFPYPFESAITIASDIDGSTMIDHNSYTDLLCNLLGLDFGDSSFFYKNVKERFYIESEFKDDPAKNAISFFNDNASVSYNRKIDDFKAMHYLDMVKKYFYCNIDHLHSLSDCGASYLIIDNMKVDDGNIILNKEVVHFRNEKCKYLSVYSILLKTNKVKRILLESGSDFFEYSYKREENGFFVFELDNSKVIPEFIDILKIKIEWKTEEKFISMVFLSFSKEQVVQMISKLNLEFPLMTDHAGTLFVNKNAEKNILKQIKDACENIDLLTWIRGNYQNEGFTISALGDDPESFFYVIQELRKYFKLRFINPSGTSGEMNQDELDLFTLLSPSIMRNNEKIYVARRLLIRTQNEIDNKTSFVDNRRTKGFPTILNELLIKQKKKCVYPVYTHLGNVPIDERKEPYFDLVPLKKLQNRVFGIDGNELRTWFTRASILYDYSLVMRGIARHVKRFKNSIYIKSWNDKILNYKLPLSVNQLNGITFYVNDTNKTKIYLNNKKIVNFVCNKQDENKKESVTIVGEGYSYSLIDDIRFCPQKATTKKVNLKTISFLEEGIFKKKNFNYNLKLTLEGLNGEVVWQSSLIKPIATQYLRLKLKKIGNLKIGILLKMKTGNYFYFGDDIDIKEKVDAKYLFKQKNKHTTNIAAFYDMHWENFNDILPSHEIYEVKILMEGKKGDVVYLDDIDLLRPSTLNHETCSLLGEMKEDINGTVKISEVDGPEKKHEYVTEINNGMFLFQNLKKNIYLEIDARTENGIKFIPSIGSKIKLTGNKVIQLEKAI